MDWNKLSSAKDVGIAQDIVREGEAWARGFMEECMDLYKVSGTVHPHGPDFAEGMLSYIVSSTTGMEDKSLLETVNKLSSTPRYYEGVWKNQVEPVLEVEAHFQTKQSGLTLLDDSVLSKLMPKGGSK